MNEIFKATVFVIGALSLGGARIYGQSVSHGNQLSQSNCGGVWMKLPLTALNDTGVTGEATICLDSSGVRSRIWARNLVPGYAYTMWFGYIDQPSACLMPGQCGELDFVVPYNPAGAFGRTDSVVAQSTEETFTADVRSLRLSHGSQVWIAAHFHGPARTDDYLERSRQLLTAQAPIFGVPEGGALVDMANGQPKGNPAFLAIFTIP